MSLFNIPVAAVVSGLLLAACGGESAKPECMGATLADWHGHTDTATYPIRSEKGQVHQEGFTFSYKGGTLPTVRCGRDSMVWCAAPHSDESCQLFVCSGRTPQNAAYGETVFEIKEHGQSFHYTVPANTDFVWDGATLRCGETQ